MQRMHGGIRAVIFSRLKTYRSIFLCMGTINEPSVTVGPLLQLIEKVQLCFFDRNVVKYWSTFDK